MSQFSKVTVDSASRKRSPFPLGGKLSTSFQFGEVAPIHCRYLTPNSSSSVNVRSLVRLDPMVAPTSQGVIKCKQWHSFVGMSDLYRHWSAYQTGKSIAGSNGIITFDKLPHMRLCDLSLFTLVGAKITPYVLGDDDGVATKSWIYYTDNDEIDGWYSKLRSAYTSVLSDTSSDATFEAMFPHFTLQNACYHFNPRALGLNVTGGGSAWLPLGNAGSPTSSITLWKGAFVDIAHCDKVFYTQFTLDGETYKMAWAVNFSNYGRRIANILDVLGIGVDYANTKEVELSRLFAYYLSYYGSFGLTKYTNYEQSNCNQFLKAYENGGNDFSALDWSENLSEPAFGDAKYLNVRFVRFMTDLVTGYVTESVDYISAHRKTDVICNDELGWVQNIVVAPDNYLNQYGAFGQSNNSNPDVTKPTTNSVFINKVSHTQVDAQILQILWKNTNRQSVAGQELEKLLRAGGYGAYCDQQQSHFLGYVEFDIDVSDINATSDSVNTVTGKNSTLGQYVGKGIGTNGKDTADKSFKYDTDESGYWITLCAIVPDSDYCQGNDQTVYDIERTDQYQREFDSQGYELQRKSVIKIGADVCNPNNTSPSQDTFGYVARFMRYKVGRSCLAGNFRRRSTRTQYLPFVLSRWLDVDDAYESKAPEDVENGKKYWLTDLQSLADAPIAGDSWRYINLYPWLANFERIFAFDKPVHNVPLDVRSLQQYIYAGVAYDYFMLFVTVKHHCEAEMLPVADSWSTTDDNNGNGKTMEQS